MTTVPVLWRWKYKNHWWRTNLVNTARFHLQHIKGKIPSPPVVVCGTTADCDEWAQKKYTHQRCWYEAPITGMWHDLKVNESTAVITYRCLKTKSCTDELLNTSWRNQPRVSSRNSISMIIGLMIMVTSQNIMAGKSGSLLILHSLKIFPHKAFENYLLVLLQSTS